MISRRSLLVWLGLAPFAIAATDLSAVANPTVQGVGQVRQRWKMVLNPDGSSDFVKGDKGFLDAWFDDKRKNLVQRSIPLRDLAELDIAEDSHKADVSAMKSRSDVWRELREFEETYERTVPVESEVHSVGKWFPQDYGPYPEVNIPRWRALGIHP